MDTITIVNPVRQARLEGWIEATKRNIAKDLENIEWINGRIAWGKEYNDPQHVDWAEELLKHYQEDLRKDEEHLKDLQTRLSEEIEKPL